MKKYSLKVKIRLAKKEKSGKITFYATGHALKVSGTF